MVKILKPTGQVGFEILVLTSGQGYESLLQARSAPDVTEWFPEPAELAHWDKNEGELRRASMPWLSGHTLALRDEAIKRVGPLLAPFGRLLRLECSEADVVAFAPRPLAGALDRARTTIVPFDDGSRIMWLENPHFHPDVVASQGAFCIPEFVRGPMYLTEHLVTQILDTGCSSGTVFVDVAPG